MNDVWPLPKFYFSVARPTRIVSVDLNSDGNEVAVDAVEIAFEALIVSNP